MKTLERKLLFVSAPFGGIEVYFQNLKRALESYPNIKSDWIWIEHRPEETLSRIPPFAWNWTLSGGLAARSRVRSLLHRGERYDAIVINHAVPAMFLGRIRKIIPTVITLDVTPETIAPYNVWYRGREVSQSGPMANIRRRMFQGVYRDAALLLPWSKLVRDSLVEHYGVDHRKLRVIRPGIDLRAWTRQRDGKVSERNGKPLSILFVGGDFLRKGGDLLLRVAKREEFRMCLFHFVTKSFQGEAPANVIVHSEMLANSKELIDLYDNADVFVLPTRADLSPNAIAEAMAFDLPVLATRVGGIPEMIEDGRTGLLFEPDNEEALAHQLRRVLSSEDLRRTLAKNGRAHVQQHYDSSKSTQMVLDALEEAIQIFESKNPQL